MKKLIPIALSAALAFLFAVPVQAQVDVTGTWELTYSTPRGERTLTVTFQQEGTTVTGKVVMQMRGRPGGAGGGMTREIEIENGKIEGDSLTFSYTMGMGERSFSQTFKAKVTGDTMEGTVEGGMRQGEPTPFTGKKKEG